MRIHARVEDSHAYFWSMEMVHYVSLSLLILALCAATEAAKKQNKLEIITEVEIVHRPRGNNDEICSLAPLPLSLPRVFQMTALLLLQRETP